MADRVGCLCGVATKVGVGGVATNFEIGTETREQFGELGDRQREFLYGIGQGDEHRMLGHFPEVGRVQLRFPIVEFARATAFEGGLIGEVIRDSSKRKDGPDVPAQIAAREERRDRIVVMTRPAQCFAIAVASIEFEGRRYGDVDGGRP